MKYYLLFSIFTHSPALQAPTTARSSLLTLLVRDNNKPTNPTDLTSTASYSAASLITVLCGFLSICCGVLLLHLSRAMAERGQSDLPLWSTTSSAYVLLPRGDDGIALGDLGETAVDEVTYTDGVRMMSSPRPAK